MAYVHFDAGTDKFDRLFISVVNAYNSDDLAVEKIINEEEKQFIIDEALKSLHKWRNTADIIFTLIRHIIHVTIEKWR